MVCLVPDTATASYRRSRDRVVGDWTKRLSFTQDEHCIEIEVVSA